MHISIEILMVTYWSAMESSRPWDSGLSVCLCVCLCVCVSHEISGTARWIILKFWVLIALNNIRNIAKPFF